MPEKSSSYILPPASDYEFGSKNEYVNKNFSGNQDDVLAYATYRFNVVQTAGVPVSRGTLADIFNPVPLKNVIWDNPTSPITLEIDMSTDILYYPTYIGMQFIYYRRPTNVKIEAVLTDNSIRVLYNVDNNNSDLVICSTQDTSSLYIGIKKLVFTFSGLNTGESKISLKRIFAGSSNTLGKTWLPAMGGEIYGDLKFNVLNYGVVLKSQNGSLYRITVDNAGNLKTLKIG